jgi:hypothetical protein
MLTFVAAYAFGVAGVIDRLGFRALREDMGGQASIWAMVADSWTVYWAFCLFAGAASGGVYYLLGGWWYRKRLKWSGASADATLARTVYLLAAQVYTLPLLVYTMWETLHYGSPRAAFDGDDPWALLVLPFLFWSVVVSYRGVRRVFTVRTWPARTWFFILPCGIYSTTVVGIFVAALLGSGLFESAPQVEQPLTLNESAYSLRYPSNWDVVPDDARPERSFSVQPFLTDAALQVFIYDFPLDTLDASMQTLDSLGQSFHVVNTRPIDRWGDFRGKGFDLDLEMDGTEYRATSFSVTFRKVSFEIIEISEAEATERLEPGFALMRDSFEFRPEALTGSAADPTAQG